MAKSKSGPLAGPQRGAHRAKVNPALQPGGAHPEEHGPIVPAHGASGGHVIDPRAVRRGNRPEGSKGGK
jgi:hypothetical protein